MTQDLPALGLSFAQLFAILRARKFTLVITLVATVLFTFALTSILPKTYTATADLFIDYPGNDPVGGRQFSSMMDESYMQTQLDMIKSEEVASRVIDANKLMQREDVKKTIEKEGEIKARSILVSQVSKSLEIVQHKTSRVLEIQYASVNPAFSRDMLNSLLQAYMDLAVRISSAPAKSRQEQYSMQLETLRKELDSIQTSITEYQQKFGIVDADERLDTSSRQLNELSTKQTAIQALKLEANAKHHAITAMIQSGVPAAEIPEIAQQRGIPELRLRLADIDRQLAEVGSVYGRNHPKFKIAMAERDILMQRLTRESQISLNSVLMEERRFDQQAHALALEIQEKQKKVLEMKQHRDVIGSYQRQMESVQKIYNSAVQKYDELLMASTVNSPRLAVLRWAVAPYTHSKPKMSSNLLMSVPVGLLLGLALIFLTEVSSRRLRHVEDLERELDIDVLGRVGERSAK